MRRRRRRGAGRRVGCGLAAARPCGWRGGRRDRRKVARVVGVNEERRRGVVKESCQGNKVAGIEGVEDLEAVVVAGRFREAEALGVGNLGESAEGSQAGMKCTEARVR